LPASKKFWLDAAKNAAQFSKGTSGDRVIEQGTSRALAPALMPRIDAQTTNKRPRCRQLVLSQAASSIAQAEQAHPHMYIYTVFWF
jgi:hypothetical protein